MSSAEKESRYSSWKEIAAYFNVDERTCQRWEIKYGLPVQRLDKKGKSRVYAEKIALDRWREAAFKDGMLRENGAAEDSGGMSHVKALFPEKRSSRRAAKKLVLVGAAIILAFGLVYILSKILCDRQPADFHIIDSALVITTKNGHELWRFNTGLERLIPEREYRGLFQKTSKDIVGEGVFPRLVIKDLNRDGKNEVLFNPCSDDLKNAGEVILFDSLGRLMWRIDTGEKIRVGASTFLPDFVLQGFDVLDLGDDGHSEILIVSHAIMMFPTRILLLDLEKTILGEYWNAGQISDFLFKDFNRDRSLDLLLGGQNNEYEKPFLALIDLRRMKGASPQGEGYRFLDKAPGQEIFYILLPLSPVQELYKPGISVSWIYKLGENGIRAITRLDYNFFDFDDTMNLRASELSHTFERLYNENVRNGLLHSPFDRERIQRKLTSDVLWYDGKAKRWSSSWAMSNPW